MSRILSKSFVKNLNKFNELKSVALLANNCDQVTSTSNYRYHHDWNESQDSHFNRTRLLIGSSLIATGIFYFKELKEQLKPKEVLCAQKAKKLKQYEKIRKDLPTYTADDVAKHADEKNGVWMTFGQGVYDITKFIPEHPGSKKNIMLGAGASIDGFWHTYQFHKEQKILDLLEKYRIGNLRKEDQVSTEDQGDPYANEPQRSPLLVPKSKTPFNAEPPLNLLVDNFITPVEYFYVRNHLPVPDIDEKDYELEVEIEGSGIKKTFKLDDLKKKFKKSGVVAVVMCGGNRRSEMNGVKEVRGLDWGAAACGNAVWEGVRLSDLLKELGVKSDENLHVILEGYDHDPTSTPYATSIPLTKAMDPRGDVILAYDMNGETLNRDHGFPIRCIVPGVVGARNVKWLGKIIVGKNESDSHWQQNDYKAFSPSTDWDNVDFKTAPAIQNMPVTSAICSPNPTEKEVKITDNCIEVKGYAYSGGGNRIIRVDVTGDQGKSWITADLQQLSDGEMVGPGRHYAWTLWTAKVPLSKGQKNIEIWSKAVDSNYNCQPETFKNTWNLRGVVSNAYSRVRVTLQK